MKATSTNNNMQKLAVDTEGLKEILDCGRMAAEEIGNKAGARFKVGRRTLWNIKKIQKFIDEISGETE